MQASIWTFALYVLTLAVRSAKAQNFPARPVRVVVSTPASGATDLVARAEMQRLSETWRQQIVIENKVGANTQIGAEAVARSAADGYAACDLGSNLVGQSPFISEAELRREGFHADQRDGPDQSRLGCASVRAGAHSRRLYFIGQGQTGTAQLRDLQDRLVEPSQHRPVRRA